MAAVAPDDRQWRQEAFDALVTGTEDGWRLSRAGANKLLGVCTKVQRHDSQRWTITIPSEVGASPATELILPSPERLVMCQYWYALDAERKGIVGCPEAMGHLGLVSTADPDDAEVQLDIDKGPQP
ncbi:hypothetical protein WJX73_001979 [Symbiochloris irregularis]|uniref:Uncharacterized protein n=1 Tax=Symbiochloris irregularis TaxID=706552 RepID=A0AAW1NQK3_9CHLO